MCSLLMKNFSTMSLLKLAGQNDWFMYKSNSESEEKVAKSLIYWVIVVICCFKKSVNLVVFVNLSSDLVVRGSVLFKGATMKLM